VRRKTRFIECSDNAYSLAKSTVLSILKNLKDGQLFIESLGETHEFGEPFTLRTAGPPTELKATIKVLDENFWTRVFLHTDFGFAGMLLHVM
jgi:hypothetical protein